MMFKKMHLEETVTFAIKHVPQVDRATLEKLIELVNLNGNYGEISYEELLSKMELVLKYIPTSCVQSLLVVIDLLEVTPSYLLSLPTKPKLHQVSRLKVRVTGGC